jgi:hypothetical protein
MSGICGPKKRRKKGSSNGSPRIWSGFAVRFDQMLTTEGSAFSIASATEPLCPFESTLVSAGCGSGARRCSATALAGSVLGEATAAPQPVRLTVAALMRIMILFDIRLPRKGSRPMFLRRDTERLFQNAPADNFVYGE